ncbi:MAG: class I SAM-dependent methyltransferase [Anaerolineaceae bacterium]|nr:class I SAM-dependent methyltransferase [Anaerolineaceae bacterium]
MPPLIPENLAKAAQRGEPSHVWRSGQERRFKMIEKWADERMQGQVFEDGCGVGAYVKRFVQAGSHLTGMDIEWPRCQEARHFSEKIFCAAGEALPMPANSMDLIFNNEVIEHVQDDRKAVAEMVRTVKPGGRIIFFCPNRWYPFETHGLYWKGKYHFGNKLFINYLPRPLRNKLCPHVRAYTKRDLEKLFEGLPVKFVHRSVVFGAYDNIIERKPRFGRILRAVLQGLEGSFLQVFGLSHFWVVEKRDSQ